MSDAGSDRVVLVEEEETPKEVEVGYVPPSVNIGRVTRGETDTYYSPVPALVAENKAVECVLGVDEAGRGPVLGPMVYGVFYLPKTLHHSLLRDRHKFCDSKVLSANTREALMRDICREIQADDKTEDGDGGADLPALSRACGFATTALAAPEISAGMLPPAGQGSYNLNAQAMDTTIALIRGVIAQGVNVTDIFVDTIGKPETYQAKLAPLFPHARVVVEKKADATYPVVSAASVAAKVTRDAALDVLWQSFCRQNRDAGHGTEAEAGHWGCGYPSDVRTTSWLKSNVHPLFGWGPETRFSWATVRDMVEPGATSTSTAKTTAARLGAVGVEWAADEVDEEASSMSISHMISSFAAKSKPGAAVPVATDRASVLQSWYGAPVEAADSI